jgi:hypothetical protein
MFRGINCSIRDIAVSVTGIARSPVVKATQASVLGDGQTKGRKLNVVSIRTSLR